MDGSSRHEHIADHNTGDESEDEVASLLMDVLAGDVRIGLKNEDSDKDEAHGVGDPSP